MVFWAKSLIIMYGIRFGGGRVEILTFIIVNGVITPPYKRVFLGYVYCELFILHVSHGK